MSDDPLRAYSEAEQQQLAENLFGILDMIHGGRAGRPGQQLMLDVHRQLLSACATTAARDDPITPALTT